MAKFNNPLVRTAAPSAIKSERTPSGRTHEGAPGYAREAKSELFLLAVANMVAENTFYEGSGERDNRFRSLVHQVATADPEWLVGMVGWLRTDANMRSAAIVAALEGAKARVDASAHGYSRQMVDGAMRRADEPGEALAYWTSRYGRRLPKPVKRGIADAATRLYNERSMLKYDTDSKGFRFGDVLDLTHPAARDDRQGDLFRHALDRRHNRDTDIPASLETLSQRAALMSWSVDQRRALMSAPAASVILNGAAMTWESLAGWLQGPMDAAAWEAIIPSMGYMALLRNLRNFDEAGVSDKVAAQVAAKLTDPTEVAKSRQFPFRFLTAYQNAPSHRWSWPLEQALSHSLSNVPALTGRTLILVDRSPSMWWNKLSARSTMDWAEAAAVFGAALALRAECADLVEFGMSSAPVATRRGESVLKVLTRFTRRDGTDIPSAVANHLKDHHNRIVIITDEQTRPGWLPSNASSYGGRRETKIDDLVPREVPLYMWNFAGYKNGAAPSGEGNRHTFGGLSDAAFRMVPLIEAGQPADWPWER